MLTLLMITSFSQAVHQFIRRRQSVRVCSRTKIAKVRWHGKRAPLDFRTGWTIAYINTKDRSPSPLLVLVLVGEVGTAFPFPLT